MELLFSFLGGFVFASVVAILVARGVLRAREESHREAMKASQERYEETIARVSEQVKSATDQMLKTRQEEFSKSSSQSIGQLVNPLKEKIAELQQRIEQENKDQEGRSSAMREQIRHLMEQSDAAKKSADELAAALRHDSKMQGDWGEVVLADILAKQGLQEGVHFTTQATLCSADGRVVRNEEGAMMRPDVVVHLDERREVIIDAKMSLTAYTDYVNAETEAARQTALKAHVESVKTHVKELAKKDYSSYICEPKVSAGYVIMFVPIAGAWWAALNADPTLWRWAADQNVCICDEQSLYGALKVVSLTWTQIVQAHNHKEVFRLADEMINRVGQLVKHYEVVGDALNKAQTAYTEGHKKLEDSGQSIMTTARQLVSLGAKESKTNPLLAPQSTPNQTDSIQQTSR